MNSSTLDQPDAVAPEPMLINPYLSGPLVSGSLLMVPSGMGAMILCDGQPLDLLPPGQHTLDATVVPQLAQHLQKSRSGAGSVTAVLLPTPGTVTMPWSAPFMGQTTRRGNMEYTIRGLVRVKIANPYKFYRSYADAWASRSRQMTEEEIESSRGLSPGKIAELWIGHQVGREASGALAPLLLPIEKIVGPGKDEKAAVAQAAMQWLESVGLECTGLTLDPALVHRYGGCDRCGRLDRPANYGKYSRRLFFFVLRHTKVEEGSFCTPCAAAVSAQFNLAMLIAGWYNWIGFFYIPGYIASNCVIFSRVAWLNYKMKSGKPE